MLGNLTRRYILTKEQYEFWSNQPETEEFFQVVEKLLEDYKNRLSFQAGENQLEDRFMAGVIYALREIQTAEFVTGE